MRLFRLATVADPVSGRSFAYGFDKNDRLTSLTSSNPSTSQIYTYDGLELLTQ